MRLLLGDFLLILMTMLIKKLKDFTKRYTNKTASDYKTVGRFINDKSIGNMA